MPINSLQNGKTIKAYLTLAKKIAPKIFENATPRFHLNILDFILKEGRFKACAVFRGGGKSTLLNKIYIFCRIFFHHEPFSIIVSADGNKAASFLRDIKEMIAAAKTLGFDIKEGKIWTTDRAEIITGDSTCYIAALGAGQDPRGYTYNFQRPTLIIADDLESKVGQYAIANIKNRQKLREWFFADLMPALHPVKGKLIIIGTILAEDSLLNNILNDDELAGRFSKMKIPIIKDGTLAWPDRYDEDFVSGEKNKLEAIGLASEFYQEYMCKAISPEKQLFKKEYLKYFKEVIFDKSAAPIYFTASDGLTDHTFSVPTAQKIKLNEGGEIDLKDCQIYTTMDLATFNGHDKTAIVTFAVLGYDIFILDIVAGHFNPFQKAVKAMEVFLKYRPSRFGIEKAGAQNDFFYTIDIIQKQTKITIPVTPLSHHSRQKNTRIAQLHPLFAAGRIYINKALPTTAELESQLLAFDPEVDSKTDDIIDATAYILEFTHSRHFTPTAHEYDEFSGNINSKWV